MYKLLLVAISLFATLINPSISFSQTKNNNKSILIDSKIANQLWSSKNTIEFLDDFPFKDQKSICKKTDILSEDHQININDDRYQKMLKDRPEIKTYQCKTIDKNNHQAFLTITPSLIHPSKIEMGGGLFINHQIYTPQITDNHYQKITFKLIDFEPIKEECTENIDQEKISSLFKLIKNFKPEFISQAIAQEINEITLLTIAVDTDYELFLKHKNFLLNQDGSIGDFPLQHNFYSLLLMHKNIVELIGISNLIYHDSIKVSFQLGNIYLYPNENDPWNIQFIDELNENGERKLDSDQLIQDVRNYWLDNRSQVSRALVWYFSGVYGRGRGYVGERQLSETKERITYNATWLDNRGIDNPENLIDQDFFGLDNLWRYGGVLCSDSGFNINGFIDPTFDSNILVASLSQVVHETGHNFGSPHTRCYNPPIDRYGSPDDLGSCEDRIDPNLPNNFQSTIMSYAPVRRMEFAQPVINEFLENLSQFNHRIEVNKPQNCSAETIIDNNQAPRIISELMINPQPAVINQDIQLSFIADDEERMIVWWKINNKNYTTQCLPNRPCELTVNFPRATDYDVSIIVADHYGESTQFNEVIRILGNPELNNAPVINSLSIIDGLGNFDGIEFINPSEPFRLLISASDPDLDLLTATIYLDGQLIAETQLEQINDTFISLREQASGRHTLTVVVTDELNETEASLELQVQALAPIIHSISKVLLPNGTYQFFSNVTDPNGITDLLATNFRWEFSDGTIIERQGLAGLFAVNHQFLVLSSLVGKSVTLTVTDPEGLSDRRQLVVTQPIRLPF